MIESREKLLHELEHMADIINDYDDLLNVDCESWVILDALELLKEQEPILVKYTTSTIRCPKCNKQITNRGALHNDINYCWKCGQAVKWK